MSLRPLLLTPLLALLALGSTRPSLAQDLVGCQLVDGQLSCAAGVSTDPQAQIRALRQQISGTLQQESAVQQGIEGMESLALEGEVAEGSLLRARAAEQALEGLPPEAFHWYRLSPGSSQWVWIGGVTGPTYRLQPQDVGSLLMLVVVRPGAPGSTATLSRRQASPAVGPVVAPAGRMVP